MDESISTAVAAERLGMSARWLAKLCEQGRVPGAKKIGGVWIIPVGVRIEPTGLGRPLRTLEIPRAGKKGHVRAPTEGWRDPKGKR